MTANLRVAVIQHPPVFLNLDAIVHYRTGPMGYVHRALHLPRFSEAIRALLQGTVNSLRNGAVRWKVSPK